MTRESNGINSIYKITNLINKKIYIGYTTYTPEQRFRLHISASQSNKDASKKQHIHNAISKYGIDNFKFEVIFQTKSVEDCLLMETYFINEYNTFDTVHGYNHSMGGEDRRRSKATIEKHKKALTGRPQSEEHKTKRGLAVSGSKNGMYGVKQDKEHMKMLTELSKIGHKKYLETFDYYYIDIYGNLFSVHTKQELEYLFGMNFIAISNIKRKKFTNNIMYVGKWQSLL